MNYRERLATAAAERGNLCVGIDPMPSVLEAWGVSRDVAGLERVARGIVEVLGQQVAAFKPQSAFFEPLGAAGMTVLERVLADIRQCGALSILDVKRGDIGSSMMGYAEAFLSPEAPLSADAITVNPYLGIGALQPAFDLALAHGRGVYVLARTSNPEGEPIQTARTREKATAQFVLDEISRLNCDHEFLIGAVLGATRADLGCDPSQFNGSILAPGIGAQGGRLDELGNIFGCALKQVLPTVSRQIIGGGRQQLQARFDELRSR